MIVPAVAPTWSAGVAPTVAQLTAVSQIGALVLNPPRCSVYAGTTGATLANGVSTPLTWDTERWDSDGMHSTVSNNSRFTAVTAGLYFFNAQVDFGSGNSTGYRQIELHKNGSANAEAYSLLTATTAASVILHLAREEYMAVGDYMEFWGYQNSGASMTLIVGEKYGFAQCRWVAQS